VSAPSFSLVFERKDGNSHQRPGISSPGLFFRREFIRGGPHVARRLRFMWGSPGCCLSIRRDSGRRVPQGRRRHRRNAHGLQVDRRCDGGAEGLRRHHARTSPSRLRKGLTSGHNKGRREISGLLFKSTPGALPFSRSERVGILTRSFLTYGMGISRQQSLLWPEKFNVIDYSFFVPADF
jgi:hypothetical protein